LPGILKPGLDELRGAADWTGEREPELAGDVPAGYVEFRGESDCDRSKLATPNRPGDVDARRGEVVLLAGLDLIWELGRGDRALLAEDSKIRGDTCFVSALCSAKNGEANPLRERDEDRERTKVDWVIRDGTGGRTGERVRPDAGDNLTGRRVGEICEDEARAADNSDMISARC